MTSKVIAEILAEHGGFALVDGLLRAPDDGEATVFATLGQESLSISKVRAVTMKDDVIVVSTRKEVFVLACGDVRALRFATRDGAAGY